MDVWAVVQPVLHIIIGGALVLIANELIARNARKHWIADRQREAYTTYLEFIEGIPHRYWREVIKAGEFGNLAKIALDQDLQNHLVALEMAASNEVVVTSRELHARLRLGTYTELYQEELKKAKERESQAVAWEASRRAFVLAMGDARRHLRDAMRKDLGLPPLTPAVDPE